MNQFYGFRIGGAGAGFYRRGGAKSGGSGLKLFLTKQFLTVPNSS